LVPWFAALCDAAVVAGEARQQLRKRFSGILFSRSNALALVVDSRMAIVAFDSVAKHCGRYSDGKVGRSLVRFARHAQVVSVSFRGK